MSTTNNLVPFEQAGGLPTFLQNQQHKSTLDEQIIGSSVDRITQRDGWIVVEEGGVKSNPAMSIDVVVLDAMPRGRDTYRAYYGGVYKEDEATAPACYSQDGRVPSPHAEKPQCTTCANCPMNVSGSGLNGEGRACGYFKHVAVVKYPELDKVYRLKVSSRSLFSKDTQGVPSPLGGMAWGFNNFAMHLQKMKAVWESVVVRVSLPKGQTHGFFFTPIGYLSSEQEFKQVLEIQKSPAVADALAVELSSAMQNTENAPAGFLPAGQPPQLPPVKSGREKWLASSTLPQNVKDWIVQVDDATALSYLTANYPTEV